jgi:hypothetical protein
MDMALGFSDDRSKYDDLVLSTLHISSVLVESLNWSSFVLMWQTYPTHNQMTVNLYNHGMWTFS